ncbi:MAG: type II toxin-antitoxin system VapC family toxin [Chthoniobacterales bacterium]
MAAYLLDSSVCVMILRGRTALAELPAPPEVAISGIVAAELWAGAMKAARAGAADQLLELLGFFPVLDFTPAAARCYGEIRADLERRGQIIGPFDLLIAAHALSLGVTLLTANAREFKRVKGLNVQAWK